MRSAVLIAVLVSLTVSFATGAPGDRPEFEVASIRPIGTVPNNPAHEISGTHLRVEVISLRALIRMAFEIDDYQLSGPDWMTTARFDVEAIAPAGSSRSDVPRMLQSLLEDRFRLRLHRESKSEAVYALRVAPGGPKLKAAAEDNSIDRELLTSRVIISKFDQEDGGAWIITAPRSDLKALLFDGPRMTTKELARFLINYAGRPVIDKTGLDSPFHVALRVPRISLRPVGMLRNNPDAPATNPDEFGDVSIFDSIKSLGLILEKQTAPIEQIIVDSVEKIPSAN